MDNSTLPPLFDNMDNVDISSPIENSEIFESAIQVREFFCFSYQFLSFFFSGCQFGTLSNHFPITHTISNELFRLSFVCVLQLRPVKLCWCQEINSKLFFIRMTSPCRQR